MSKNVEIFLNYFSDLYCLLLGIEKDNGLRLVNDVIILLRYRGVMVLLVIMIGW